MHTFHQRNVVAQSPCRPHCGRHRVLLSFASQCIEEASEVSLHASTTTILQQAALHSEDGAENPYAGPATIGRHRTRLHVGNMLQQ